ncbi:MAG: NAD(P)H-hydrate dehydratase [Proteobacteria bacterium]|nr:NAD(P)H-hydrate dehydratase [Pseudomonadota bacterium]
MSDLPLALYSSKDVKKIDNLAVQKLNITGYELMCRAGEAAFKALQNYWPAAKNIKILCGPGNNGGDGFVLARLAKMAGLNVSVFLVGERGDVPLQAKQAREDWLKAKGEITLFQDQNLVADVVVDALLGTGFHFPLPDQFATAIRAINKSNSPVLAVDIPSGLEADTGSFDEVVYATRTITFIALKIGMVCAKAIDVVGELIFDDLGINAGLFTQVKPMATCIVFKEVIHYLAPRPLSSHKGDNGHVCIIGGGKTGYSGAVCLAGEAALRAGAGLVSAVISPESLPLMARAPAELMTYSFSRPKAMRALLEAATVLVLGPGLSQNAWGKKFFQESIKTTKPCVIDADGLNWLACYPQKREHWILTPHPGEAGRLLGMTTAQVQNDRIHAAIALKEKFGGIIVLKGAGTIVVGENSEIAIHVGGYPALSTGGTGDVLAGLIGGLVGQKLSLFHAACLGVSVHAGAAALEQALGARGMLASDLFLHIRNLINPEG